jgi:hypothetical protein
MSSSAFHLLPVAITVSPPNAVLSLASLRMDVQPGTPLISSSSQALGRGWSRSIERVSSRPRTRHRCTS